MKNLNSFFRRLMALLLCACMVLGNVSAALSDTVLELFSSPVPLMQSAAPLSNVAAEAELSDYVNMKLGLYADRYYNELPSVLEDGQSLYAVLECAFKRDENNQATTLLQQAYRAGQIDHTTVFTSEINFLKLMTGNSYPTSAEDAGLAQTTNGNPIFRWWVDVERGLICLTFVETALKLDGTIDDGKLSFSGNLDLSGADDNGNLNFSIDNETVLHQAKQGYALEKQAGKPRLDLNAKGYVVDYTVTLTLDRNMQLDASAGQNLYTAALTLVDTLSEDTALTGDVYGTPAITGPDADVSISVAHNNATTNTFTIDSTDKVLPKGTYTITYQMMLKDDAAAVKLKDYEESRRTNTVELMEDGEPVSETDPVTAYAVTAWDNSIQNRFKIDKDVFTNKDPLSKYFYGAYYDENSKQYYVDYRIVVYVQEEVSTFTVTDDITSYLEFPDETIKPIVLEGWDDSETFWTNNIHTAELDQLSDVEVTTEPGANAHQKLITVKAAEGAMLQPGAYHLRVPVCITNAVNNALYSHNAQGYNNKATLTTVDGIPTTETDTCYGQVQKYTPPEKSGSFEVNTDGSYATVEVDGKTHYLLRWELWIGWYFYNETVLQDVMEGTTLYVNSTYPFDIHSYDGRGGKLHQEKLATFNTLSNTDYITFNEDGKGFTFNAHKLNLNTGDAGEIKSPVGAYKIVYYTVSDAEADGKTLPTGIKNTYKVDYKAPHGEGFNNGPIPGEAEPQISNAAKLSVDKQFKRMLNDIHTEWQIVVHNPNAIPFSRLNSLNILDVVSDTMVTPKLNDKNQSSVNNRDNVQVLYSETWPIQVKMKLNDSTTVPLESGTHYTIEKNYIDEGFPNDYGPEFGSNGEYGYVIKLNIEAVAALAAQHGADTFEEITVSTYLVNSDKESGYLYYIYNQGHIIYETIGQKFRDVTEAKSTDQRSFSVKTKDAPLYGDYYDPNQSASYSVHSNGSTSGTTTTIRGTYDKDANTGDGQQEILWSILAGAYEFEKDSNPIKVTITDTLSSNQMFPVYDGMDPIDLFHIYSNKKPEHVIKPDSLTVNGNTFTLTFTVPGGQWCGSGNYLGADVRVTYHTVIKPEAMQEALDKADNATEAFTVEYSNNASVGWNGWTETVENSGSHTFTTNMLSKTSDVDETESEIVYTIVINDRGLLLNGGEPLVLQDSLGNTSDFRYKADSFVLTDMDTGKKLVKGISVDENTYTLSWDDGFTISVPDGKRLQLTYRVDPLVEVGVDTPALINTATLNGKTVSKTQDSFRVLESDQEASVTLNDGVAGVTIRKVDATESTDNFLPNAEFAIYKVNQDGTLGQQVKTIATGENGKILLQLEHTAGTGYDTVFCMKETKAPAGYQANMDAEWYFYISTDTLEFGTTDVKNLVEKLRADGKTVVQLYNKSSSAIVDVQNDPYVCDLTVQKQSFGGSALSGAAFTLTDGDGNLVESFVVPEGGYTLTGLKSGEYTLFENSAPMGYTLGDVTQWSFTLDAEAKTIVWADGTTDAALAYVELSSNADSPVLTVRNDGATAQLTIPVTKVLDGTDTTDQAFSFQLAAVTSGSPVPEETTITTSGASYTNAMAEVCFGSIEYTYDDIGTHIYRVTENAVDASSGFLTDATVYQVGVDVEWVDSDIVANIRSITANGKSADAVAFTNVYVPYISISGTKTWVDHDDYAQLRPDELTITLMADGSPALDEDGNAITQVISGEGNVWSYTFADLPKYDGDHEIVYTVSEATPAGYTSSQGADAYSLVNTHIPVTSITVNKIWNDANDQDGKRSSVVANVTLYKAVEGTAVEVETVTVGAEDNWSKKWENLPVYDGGKLITYSVIEVLETANGYTSDTTEAVVVANGGSKTITNSYTPEKTDITVTKTWNDANNQDGKRASVVAKVTLKKTVDGATTDVDTVTVGAEDNWSKKWENLPVYESGKLITYSVVEVLETANGYISDTTEAAIVANGGSKTITNSYTPEKTDITVTKTWNDANNQDGKRAGVVAKVTLYKTVEGAATAVETVTVGAEDNWSKKWENLPVYDGGKLITYSVVEVLETANDYTSDTTEAVVVANGGSKTITNSYTPEKTDITVTKTWNDANNQDGKRASVVAKVTLYKTVEGAATAVETVTVGAEDNWSKKWENLPVYESGKLITYSVVEVLETDNGYTSDTTTAVTVANGGSKTITNSYTPEKTDITVTKTWNDANNQDGKRAGVVAKVTLKKTVDGATTDVDTVTVGTGDNWSKKWENLPVYDGGKLITYSVVEVLETDNGYISDTTEAVVVANGGSKTITNSYTPEKTDITVTKTWNDANNQDGKRASVGAKVTLYKTVEGAATAVETVTVGAEDNWSKKWENLPVYESGKLITYSVVEVLETDNGYTSDTTEAVVVANGGSKTITNSYTPKVTSITVHKVWSDNDDQDGKRADVVAKVTLYKTVEGAAEAVETVTVGAEDNWSKKWENLPVYDGGKLITYSVVEVLETANGYTSDTATAVTVANGGSKTITNSYTPEKTDITVTKTWNDANNQDGKRAGVVAKVTLKKTVDGATTDVDTVTVGTGDNWSKKWENLPVYDGGKLITYSVVEVLETDNGYISDTTEAVVVANGGSKTITNSYTPEKTDITVTKTWNDANNQDGKRASVGAKVTLKKTVDGATTDVDTVTVGAEDNWSKKWENLPVYESGKLITYSVVEVLETDNGYTSDTTEAVVVANGGSKTITNSYTPEKTDITVTKTWNDANNQDGKRASVGAKVTLKKTVDGATTDVDTVTVGTGDNWSKKWENLPVYDGGKLITYSVVEVLETDNGYTSDTATAVTVANGGSKTITNSYTPEKTDITVTKTWNDANNQDGKRADVVAKVTLYKTVEGAAEAVETVTVGAEDNWSKKWENLPVYDGGKLITYSVVEVLETDNGYISDTTEAVVVANGGSKTITNSYTPEKTDITVTKTWNDANNQDGKRASVGAKVTLKKTVDGATTDVDTVTVGTGDNWSKKWENLPVYDGGKLITYSVVEVLETDNGYISDTTEAVVVANGGSKTITNSYTPEKTDITVTKTWNDANNQDGKRASVGAKVTLYKTVEGAATAVETVTVGAEDNWSKKWENLPVYESGKLITYSVVEVLETDNGYISDTTEAAIVANGGSKTITNSYTPEKTDITVTKTWNDANNQDGKRASVVAKVTLYKTVEGAATAVETVTVGAEDNWSKKWENLPVYDGGKLITYSVVEVLETANGYTSDTIEAAIVANGVSKTITNSHTPETIEIAGSKTWDDANDQDGLRPDSITINLLADGEVIDTIEVKEGEDGAWKWQFTDLPKYRDQGVEIVYSITETLDETTAAAYSAKVDGYNVTNTHTPATVDVTGSKIWIDLNDSHHTRPKSITIRLLADGTEIASQVVNMENNWNWSFSDLPKYAEGKVGQEVVYTVTEDSVAGYVATQNGYSFTNTVQMVAFQKLDEQTGNPLSGAGFALYEGRLTAPAGTPLTTWTSTSKPQVLAGLITGKSYTIFETKTPFGYITMSPFVFTVQETDTPSGMRTLTATNRHSYRFRKLSSRDNELVYGAEMAIMQGDTIIATWFTNYENDGWHYVADHRFKAGVTYTLVELTAPNGYRLASPMAFSIDPDDGFLIVSGIDTNDISVVMYDQPVPAATPTPEPATTTFRVTKQWEDQDNVLGLRPNSIVLNLFRKTSNEADYPTSPYLTVTVNSNGTDEWTFTFSDLPRRDNSGRMYTYMVQEEPVEGYVATYLNNGRTIVNSIPVEDLPPTPTPTLPYATPTPSPMPRVPAGVQFIDGKWVYVDEYGIPLGGVPLTGDNTNFALWGCAIVLPMLIAALAAVEIRRRKRLMATEGKDE